MASYVKMYVAPYITDSSLQAAVQCYVPCTLLRPLNPTNPKCQFESAQPNQVHRVLSTYSDWVKHMREFKVSHLQIGLSWPADIFVVILSMKYEVIFPWP